MYCVLCVQHYEMVTGLLTPVERRLLVQSLKKLQHVLDPGLTQLNWNALGIPDFVHTCMKAINEFKSVVTQVFVLKP